ncbi:MAG: rod shape-determining protein MreC, partial [Pedobacter sp.]
LGSLVWGDGNFDFRSAYVKEIPNQNRVNRGDTVITSGAGFFPKGILVGKVANASVATGDNYMSLLVSLFNDFSTLQYVYVITDKLASEQTILENRSLNEQ